MVSAGLFSLAVHVALLFFIRFIPPVLENLAGKPALLNVILEHRDNAVLNPTDIPLASQESTGEAKIGVQKKGGAVQGVIPSLVPDVDEQAGAEIPQAVSHEKILALDTPQPLKVEQPVARIPDALPAKSADPVPAAQPEEKKDSSAPLPSVAKPSVAAAPSAQKLVSSEPVRGELQDRIALVEQPRDKVVPEQPAPQEMPKPAEPAKQMAREELMPVRTEEQKPVKAQEPAPSRVEADRPARSDEPRPARAEDSKPSRAEAPQPAKVAETKAPAAVADGVKPGVAQAKLPGFETAGLPLPGIPLIKKIAAEDDKHTPTGERRKTVSVKERDFRYAMYMEGLRLKLERIGSLNYPAAAAGGRLSGTLSVRISIRADGSLENVSIVRPAKEEELNAGAEKIVRMSAPFSPLSEDIRREADILSVTIRWTFSNSRQLFD